jgi:hypothetical protein
VRLIASMILVGAGRLADEHQIGLGVAHAEDHLRPPERVQLTARAVTYVGADGRQRVSGTF